MKLLLCIVTLMLASQFAPAQWVKQTVNTTASFRGLSVVDENIVWASGTDGTVIKTIDGGETWKVMTVPGAEKLDFRDIEAFDANTAYILSIGNGESSRIYKTTDGGKTWKEQFRNKNEKAFFDALACWDQYNCMAISDPVDNKFVLIKRTRGNANWIPIDTSKMPKAKDGEAAFAASGTCLIVEGRNNVFFVTGGSDARVFKSTNRGETWRAYETPIVRGTSGSGIFSIAMRDSKHGVIVGGNYEKPDEKGNNIAYTKDGGKTWNLGEKSLNGYRSSVAYENARSYPKEFSKEFSVHVVGTTGWERSWKGETDWVDWNSGSESGKFNSVASYKTLTWAVGEKGLVVRTEVTLLD